MSKTLDWVLSQELESGGLAAWPGVGAYPEVTGYMIPTLINHGATDLAERLGSWLVDIQNHDGSFSSMEGLAHSFDTGACLEGLKATGNDKAAHLAHGWLESQLLPNGLLPIHTGTTETHVRDLRTLAIIGGDPIDVNLETSGRWHYKAYALEGYYNMGVHQLVENELEMAGYPSALMSNTLNGQGTDTCATAQIAVLRARVGLPYDKIMTTLLATMNPDGSFPHDQTDNRKVLWACKYFLDLLTEVERATSGPAKQASRKKGVSAGQRSQPKQGGSGKAK